MNGVILFINKVASLRLSVIIIPEEVVGLSIGPTGIITRHDRFLIEGYNFIQEGVKLSERQG